MVKKCILTGLALLFAFTLAFVQEQAADARTMAPIRIKVTIGQQVYTAYLERSETAEKFVEMMPMTVTMQNTNNREMRYNLSTTLPSLREAKRNEYTTGDIGYLATSRSLVIFYKHAGGTIDGLQHLGRFEADVAVLEQMESAEITFELDDIQQ